ncbi:MAG: hypothetical protein N2491_01825 [Negativicutes bacterium]|nr:hypothetical protein [Negativicutes bacterium]
MSGAAVEQFIADNFAPGSVIVEDFPLFPYGRRLIDKTGSEMVVFWDCWTQSVKWVFPD